MIKPHTVIDIDKSEEETGETLFDELERKNFIRMVAGGIAVNYKHNINDELAKQFWNEALILWDNKPKGV